MINPRTRTIIIWVVLAVWVANFSGGMVIDHYKPNEAVNGIFMIIVGTLFTMGGRPPGNGGGGGEGGGGGGGGNTLLPGPSDDSRPRADAGVGGG